MEEEEGKARLSPKKQSLVLKQKEAVKSLLKEEKDFIQAHFIQITSEKSIYMPIWKTYGEKGVGFKDMLDRFVEIELATFSRYSGWTIWFTPNFYKVKPPKD